MGGKRSALAEPERLCEMPAVETPALPLRIGGTIPVMFLFHQEPSESGNLRVFSRSGPGGPCLFRIGKRARPVSYIGRGTPHNEFPEILTQYKTELLRGLEG